MPKTAKIRAFCAKKVKRISVGNTLEASEKALKIYPLRLHSVPQIDFIQIVTHRDTALTLHDNCFLLLED